MCGAFFYRERIFLHSYRADRGSVAIEGKPRTTQTCCAGHRSVFLYASFQVHETYLGRAALSTSTSDPRQDFSDLIIRIAVECAARPVGVLFSWGMRERENVWNGQRRPIQQQHLDR